MNVLHRTTKQYLTSVNTPDYSVATWIHDPDLSAVTGYPSKYWTISGDTVSLMSQAERDAVDAAELVARRDEIADELDAAQTVLRAFAETLLDERNADAARINAIRDAIATANNLNDAKTAAAAVADSPTRTLAQLKAALRNKLDG